MTTSWWKERCRCGWKHLPVLITVVKTLFLVLIFYSFSISLTFFNKKYIGIYPYPLCITILHLSFKFSLAWLMRACWERWRDQTRIEVSWRDYIRRVAPTGISSSLDIGLSNWSFEFITVSLYTMTKSSALIFILLFAIYFKLEEKRWSLVLVIILIASGLFLFTYKSTEFHPVGFSLVLLASVISGLRWTTAQLVTQRAELGLCNPLDVIYHVQPWMLAALLPLALAFEGIEIGTTELLFRAEDTRVILKTVSTLMLGAFLAFGLEWSEYLLISHTSSLTLSISGIFKEICTLYLAATFNGDTMNPLNAVGLALCLSGISLHCGLKVWNASSAKTVNAHQPRAPEDPPSSPFGLDSISETAVTWQPHSQVEVPLDPLIPSLSQGRVRHRSIAE